MVMECDKNNTNSKKSIIYPCLVHGYQMYILQKELIIVHLYFPCKHPFPFICCNALCLFKKILVSVLYLCFILFKKVLPMGYIENEGRTWG